MKRRSGASVVVLVLLIVLVIGLGVVLASRHLTSASKDSPARPASGGDALDPAEFAAGSCVAFAPTSGNRNETVFLDAGHGGIDPGGVGTTEAGTTIYEADVTLPIELDTQTAYDSIGRSPVRT